MNDSHTSVAQTRKWSQSPSEDIILIDNLYAIDLATELTVAWLANPNSRTSADDVPGFLQQMHAAVTSLSTPASPEEAQAQKYTGAVTARKSWRRLITSSR